MVQNEPVRITVHVRPNDSKNKVAGFQDGVLKVRIAAPPVKGKANQELVKYLSSLLGISKSKLNIEKGTTGKNKVVSVRGVERHQVLQLLENAEKARTSLLKGS